MEQYPGPNEYARTYTVVSVVNPAAADTSVHTKKSAKTNTRQKNALIAAAYNFPTLLYKHASVSTAYSAACVGEEEEEPP